MGERKRLEPGDRIGEYRIDAVRARGALWDELDATHVLLPRKVVVRVTAETGLPPAGVRLLREACIVEALAHPGVPRLYNCGRLPDRRPWIAGERVAGRSLAEVIGDDGAVEAVRVAALLRHVAAILDHAHGHGVVHRQIRPETIVLTDGERGWPVCVIEWSEARAHDSVPAPRLTGPHDAPEVARGEHYDGKVDVYALGVVAFEAITGVQLFHGAAPLDAVADRVMRELRTRGEDSAAGAQLAWLVDDMLAFDPVERPSAAEVVASAAAIAAVLDAEAETATAEAEAEMEADADAHAVDVDVAVDDFATEAATLFAEVRLARASTDREGDTDDLTAEATAAVAAGSGPALAPAPAPEPELLAEADYELERIEVERVPALERVPASDVLAKIRTVRWTPPYPGHVPLDGEIVSGEILPKPRPRSRWDDTPDS